MCVCVRKGEGERRGEDGKELERWRKQSRTKWKQSGMGKVGERKLMPLPLSKCGRKRIRRKENQSLLESSTLENSS